MKPINLHPDGMAWQKQCRGMILPYHDTMNCAYMDGWLTPDDEHWTRSNPFPCWHRTEDGFYRICAGWAKHHRKDDK
jgi:hypothetical protein